MVTLPLEINERYAGLCLETVEMASHGTRDEIITGLETEVFGPSFMKN